MVEKYYKLLQKDGHNIELSIYQKSGWSGSRKEIGDFVDLRLELQGGQADVHEPIFKTSLTFSMINSSDKTSTNTIKYGNWEEFYTPDATMYLVMLKVDSANVWSGYITPDSWEDDLQYRGVITVTARDMIGHLNDFEFALTDLTSVLINSADRMVKVRDVISTAFSIASIPMTFQYYTSGSTKWMKYDNVKAYDWAVDAQAFVGMTWYEVVENILTSLGLALRYNGTNSIVMSPLRNMPLCGKQNAASVQTKVPVFINRTGHRTLSPAYRQVVEQVDFDEVSDIVETFPASDFTDRGSDNYLLNKAGWEILSSQQGGWLPDTSLSSAMRPYNISGNTFNDEAADPRKYVMLQVYYTAVPIFAWRRTVLVTPRTTAHISWTIAHTYTRKNSSWNSVANLMPTGVYRYRLEWVPADGSSSLFFSPTTKSWGLYQSAPWFNYDLETDKSEAQFDVSVTMPETPGRLKIWFFCDSGNYQVSGGVKYVRLGDFSVSVEAASIPTSSKITTVYDSDQNYTLQRDPQFGQLPSWVVTAGSIINGIYLGRSSDLYPPVQNCAFDRESVVLPVPVLNHMQLLAYHAKANNVLQGDMIVSDRSLPTFGTLWQIFGKNFLLIAGTVNYVTWIVEDAILVEYDTYESVFGSASASYNLKDDNYRAGNTTASVTVTGGGGGGGGGTTDYLALTNKPSINSIELTGNKTLAQLGIQGYISDLADIRAGSQSIVPGTGTRSLRTDKSLSEGYASVALGKSWDDITLTLIAGQQYTYEVSGHSAPVAIILKVLQEHPYIYANSDGTQVPITASLVDGAIRIVSATQLQITTDAYQIRPGAFGVDSLQEGLSWAMGESSHAESRGCAEGDYSHAECGALASGDYAHAEGADCEATGDYSHAECHHTKAVGQRSHAEGTQTISNGAGSHAEGQYTRSNGAMSHAEGDYTEANNRAEHAQGRYNKSNTASSSFGDGGNTIHSVGIGTEATNRRNAEEIMQNGDMYLFGIGNYDGTNPEGASTVQQVLSGLSKDSIGPAPQLVIRRGYSSRNVYEEYMIISHSMLGQSGCEAVLMVFRGRNGRKSFTSSTAPKWKYKKGWAVAMGDYYITGHTAFVASGVAGIAKFELDSLRNFIIKRFMKWTGKTRAQLYALDYQHWQATSSNVDRGFSPDTSGYKRFGVAIRIANPAFSAEVTPGTTVDATTQMINGVPRYLYSDVAPLEGLLMSDPNTNNKRQMMFGTIWK